MEASENFEEDRKQILDEITENIKEDEVFYLLFANIKNAEMSIRHFVKGLSQEGALLVLEKAMKNIKKSMQCHDKSKLQ